MWSMLCLFIFLFFIIIVLEVKLFQSCPICHLRVPLNLRQDAACLDPGDGFVPSTDGIRNKYVKSLDVGRITIAMVRAAQDETLVTVQCSSYLAHCLLSCPASPLLLPCAGWGMNHFGVLTHCKGSCKPP